MFRVLLALCFFVGISANAQTSSVLVDDLDTSTFQNSKFKPFFGASFGYMDENRDLRTEGTPWNVKFIGSFYSERNWLVDGGIGVLGQHFSNAESKTALAGTLEVGSRYRFKGDWQLGPHLKTYTGVGDLYGSSTNLLTSFVGAQGMKEFTAFKKYRSRVGLSVMTDIGIPNEVAYVTSLELQVSLESLFNSRQPVARALPPAPAPVKQVRSEQKQVSTLFFEMGEIQVNDRARQDLRASISQMKASGDIDDTSIIKVVGYADQVGERGLNLKVSRNRARAVRNELINGGVRADQIQVLWRGEEEATGAERDQRDRRVVIKKIK